MPDNKKAVEQAAAIEAKTDNKIVSVPPAAEPEVSAEVVAEVSAEVAAAIDIYSPIIWRVVKERVAFDREHGWVQADSMAVITAILKEEIGDKPDYNLLDAIEQVVNPSAFRIKLEGMVRKDGQTVLQKHEGKKRGSPQAVGY